MPSIVTSLVFEEGDVIGVYRGDRYRPCDASIADYSVGYTDEWGSETVIDALQYRGFISYANQPFGKEVENCSLGADLRLRATRDIFHGQQLLWNYGSQYTNEKPIEVKRG